ncbi:uncharacterized protein [Dermacentor albipictus]|uniref:uncharacterized protein n=1 Tax=Dermacentor albipictus TaxID=60249 RepID=UPI0038FBF023
MEQLLKLPEPLLLPGNITKNWELFRQKFELFLEATESPKEPRTTAAKTALLLSTAGDDALEVFSNFLCLGGENKQDYAAVVEKFKEYCQEQQNEVYERYIFRSRVQGEGEAFEHFLRDLRKQARSCNFSGIADSLIRDQIVFGTSSPRLREKLLKEKDLTLAKAEQIFKAEEAALLQNNAWAQPDKHVALVMKRSGQVRKAEHAVQKEPSAQPACCKKGQQIREVGEEQDSFDILDVTVSSIDARADWVVHVKVADQMVNFKVDTGSQANLLPYSIYRRCKTAADLKPSSSVLRSYSGGVIRHFGMARLPVTVNGRSKDVNFYVVKKGNQAILGLLACESLGLVSRAVDAVKEGSNTAGGSEDVLTEFRQLFQGTGCVSRQYKMVLRKDATPVVQPARRVPLALREREELERMQRSGIIERVQKPTDW